jgi:hypothetical protein
LWKHKVVTLPYEGLAPTRTGRCPCGLTDRTHLLAIVNQRLRSFDPDVFLCYPNGNTGFWVGQLSGVHTPFLRVHWPFHEDCRPSGLADRASTAIIAIVNQRLRSFLFISSSVIQTVIQAFRYGNCRECTHLFCEVHWLHEVQWPSRLTISARFRAFRKQSRAGEEHHSRTTGRRNHLAGSGQPPIRIVQLKHDSARAARPVPHLAPLFCLFCRDNRGCRVLRALRVHAFLREI